MTEIAEERQVLVHRVRRVLDWIALKLHVVPPDVDSQILAWFDRRRWYLFATVAALYLAGFNGMWRVGSDTSLYLALGRNLASGQGYTYHGEGRAYPGLPWVISLAHRWIGTGEAQLPAVHFAVLVVMLATTAATLALVYRLMFLHAGRPTAVLITCLCGVSYQFYQYSYEILTEIPFLLGVMLFLVGYEGIRKLPGRRHEWIDWAQMAAGTMVMASMRPTALTFIGSVGLVSAWHLWKGPQRFRHVFVGLLVIVCFLVMRQVDPRSTQNQEKVASNGALLNDLLTNRFGWMLNRTFAENLPQMFESAIPRAVFGGGVRADMGVIGVDVGVIAAIILVCVGVALTWRRGLWGVFVCATMAQTMIVLPYPRYLVPIVPLLIYAYWRTIVWYARRMPYPWGPAYAVAVLLLLIVPNAERISGFAKDQRVRQVMPETYKDGRYQWVQAMAGNVRRLVGKDDLVLSDSHRAYTYLSGRRCETAYFSNLWKPLNLPLLEERLKSANAVWAIRPMRRDARRNLWRSGWWFLPEVVSEGNLRLGRVVPISELPTTQPVIDEDLLPPTTRPNEDDPLADTPAGPDPPDPMPLHISKPPKPEDEQ